MRADYEVLLGDCVEGLRGLPDGSVHTCVTSPPYFGLRDDGTLWLNLGDSYASGGGSGAQGSRGQRFDRRHTQEALGDVRRWPDFGIKPKDLIGIPWRVAFALQADGWYLRQEVIWHKPNPMPESVRDRPTKAHEYLFLLTKGPRYYFEQEAVKEPLAPATGARLSQPTLDQQVGAARVPGKTNGNVKAVDGGESRNRRSVWSITTKPYSGAHFATFPPDLIEPCILAGAPPGGLVLDPFGGSGTAAGVAVKNGRRAILCELNPEYAALMPDRVRSIAGDVRDLFLRPEVAQ